MTMPDIKAVVLAAGKGTRLHSEEFDLPKVLRRAAGRPLLAWVLDSIGFIPAADTILVVGYKKEAVLAAFPDYPFAEQTEQLGTGHTVMAAADALRGFDGDVLVCCGDMPLIRRGTFAALAEAHFAAGNDCTVLSGRLAEPASYGRIVRGADGAFLRMVEHRDCSPAELLIDEVNSGVYLFRCPALLDALGGLRRGNAQGEYYLTDVPEILLRRGARVAAFCGAEGGELLGVNTPEQLAEAERLLTR